MCKLRFSPGSHAHVINWIDPGLPGVGGSIVHLGISINNVDVVLINPP
jgi:hypothetical protein